MCDICESDADHDQVIHRLHGRISKLEELLANAVRGDEVVSDQSVESDQPEEFESLPPRPRCEICGVPNSEPHNQVLHLAEAMAVRLGDRLVSTLEKLARPAPQPVQESLPTPSPSLGDYERVLAPLRAEVVSAAMEWRHTRTFGEIRLRKACEKLHETLVRLNREYGE
jgi:hypothetical protein